MSNEIHPAFLRDSEKEFLLRGTNKMQVRVFSKKIVDLKDVIQKEVDKQLDSNGHLERIQFQNEIIKKQKKEIKELKEMMNMERKCMQYELDDAEQEIDALNKENKEMTGSLVKVEWVIEQVKKVGGFTDTGKAVAEAFEYIDFPETSEVEKEDFVASSITNSVVRPSSIQEDREFYGEDFHEESDVELDTPIPWYEERYPTTLEVQSAMTIQNYIRNHD